MLHKAVAAYREEGNAAFARFSRQGEFVDGDQYVYVVDENGYMLASGGPSAALIGRDITPLLTRSCRRHSTPRYKRRSRMLCPARSIAG
ncbi:hypothetical protein ULF88_06785 [Halopseudomonas pachastrellae]|nr:hypothetical protein [Halopseudomonas pachastrellae]